MHEKRNKSGVLQTVVFADRALEAKNAQVPSGKQNFDGRLKPKKRNRTGQRAIRVKKDTQRVVILGVKGIKKLIFEAKTLRVVFFKCASHLRRGAHF